MFKRGGMWKEADERVQDVRVVVLTPRLSEVLPFFTSDSHKTLGIAIIKKKKKILCDHTIVSFDLQKKDVSFFYTVRLFLFFVFFSLHLTCHRLSVWVRIFWQDATNSESAMKGLLSARA